MVDKLEKGIENMGMEVDYRELEDRIDKAYDVDGQLGQPRHNGDGTISVELKQLSAANDYKTRLEFLAHQSDLAVNKHGADYLEFTDNNYAVGGDDLTINDMLHMGFEKVGEDSEKHSIWRMQAFEDCVEGSHGNSDGTRTADLRHIPFEKDYKTQGDFIRYQSNLAAQRGADRMEFTLKNGYRSGLHEVTGKDMQRLGFHETTMNQDRAKTGTSTWTKPVVK